MIHPARAGIGVSRRRVLTIAGCAAGVLLMPRTAIAALATPLHRWKGIALGAEAEIRLYHPDEIAARRILAKAEAEIRRLEAIFSLYRADSALARLNRDGRCDAPPLDLVELLALCSRVHTATDGAFDPTIQPLWALYAEHFGAAPESGGPSADAIAAALDKTGWRHVAFDAGGIAFRRNGMALTLNGIAQGFITDRVSTLLKSHGITDVLVDLGEISAVGSQEKNGDGWRIRLDPAHSGSKDTVMLRDRAVASSAAAGTLFGGNPAFGHILDPRNGRPAASDLQGVSVMAPDAATADGLSTAALVSGLEGLKRSLGDFEQVGARALRADGTILSL
jgi:thiamine biosynthesis lipoprotein